MPHLGANGVSVEDWVGQMLVRIGDVEIRNLKTVGPVGADWVAARIVDWDQAAFQYTLDDTLVGTRLPLAGQAVRRLNRDSRVIDSARGSEPPNLVAPSGPSVTDGSHRLASFRALVDIARAHTSYTSREVARRAVRLRPAERFVEIGSREYVREHGFDHHTCGARPGTATLAGSSTPVAPPRAA